MKGPGKTSLRYAADTTFHLNAADRTAKHVERTALSGPAIRHAERVQDLVKEARREAKAMERVLIR